MPKPQLSELSEAIVFEGASPGKDRDEHIVEVERAAKLAGSQATEAATQAANRAVRLNQILRDNLGPWIDDGIKLKSTSDDPYALEIEAQNRHREQTEITHTEVEVVPGSGRQRVGLTIDTTESMDKDPAASLTIVNPETGEEYSASALDPAEQVKLPGVVGRLEADIERRLEEGNFEAQPLPH